MIHRFVCDKCGHMVEDENTKIVHVCPSCQLGMRWDLKGIGIRPGDYEHISDSLAIHPDDIPEHRKKFPGVDILPDGRPRFTSPKQQECYAHACGFDKKEQKRRSLGKTKKTY